MGNMTNDIEIRTTPNGKMVGSFGLAMNSHVKKGGEGEPETTFVDVTAWERTADLLDRFGGKGKTILVSGRLKQERWEDKATGTPRSKLVVTASEISIISKGDSDEGRTRTHAGASEDPQDLF